MSNRENNREKMHRQFLQAFFTELINFLDELLTIIPKNERYDIVLYKSLIKNTTSNRDKMWFLDSLKEYVIEPHRNEIMNKDVEFFTSNADSLIMKHEGSAYVDEILNWIEKIRTMWNNKELVNTNEDMVWNYLHVFVNLSDKELSLRY